MKFILLCSVVVLSAACAQKPEDIQPSYVSPTTYEGLTCRQLGQEAARVDAALTRASAAQNTARSNDTAGVILLGLPVSSLSGANQSAQIADLKGRQDVLAQSIIAKKCR